MKLNRILYILMFITGILSAGSCGLVHDDLSPCESPFRLHFVYDYNIKFADAFANEVKSVNVWAFDKDGKPVWKGEAKGEVLKQKDFTMDVNLPTGTYDFLAWCGLDGNDCFDLSTYNPTSITELETKLLHEEEEGLTVSKKRLPALFHGKAFNVTHNADPEDFTPTDVTISLVKDTQDLRVMLQNADGSALDPDDFTVTIKYANAHIGWDNELQSTSPMLVYKHWNLKYGTSGSRAEDGAIEDISSLLFEHSISRMKEGGDAILTIHRKWDDRDIFRFRLIDHLLKVKGHYEDMEGREIGNQEYLDRQDDYSLMFVLDPASNWNVSGFIYINGWAVVPDQDEEL